VQHLTSPHYPSRDRPLSTTLRDLAPTLACPFRPQDHEQLRGGHVNPEPRLPSQGGPAAAGGGPHVATRGSSPWQPAAQQRSPSSAEARLRQPTAEGGRAPAATRSCSPPQEEARLGQPTAEIGRAPSAPRCCSRSQEAVHLCQPTAEVGRTSSAPRRCSSIPRRSPPLATHRRRRASPCRAPQQLSQPASALARSRRGARPPSHPVRRSPATTLGATERYSRGGSSPNQGGKRNKTSNKGQPSSCAHPAPARAAT
jgi:hypothetical protein